MAAAGGRFAVTCGLMRQYMKEQQQGAGAPRPPAPVSLLAPAQETADTRTMQLFPTSAPAVPWMSQQRTEVQATAPLTIFYDGRVVVFEDFPAEKLMELMQLTESYSSPALLPPPPPPVMPQSPAPPQAPRALSDLPIARKASLQRFLATRRHRIHKTDPYQKAMAPPPATVRAVNNEPSTSWLGL